MDINGTSLDMITTVLRILAFVHGPHWFHNAYVNNKNTAQHKYIINKNNNEMKVQLSKLGT